MAEFKLFLEDFMDLLNAQESSIVKHVPSKCVQSEGLFYWIYPNGTTIGRKLRK